MSNRVSNIALAASAVAMLAFAQPAFAAEGSGRDAAKSHSAAKGGEKKICAKMEGFTGSRVSKLQCKTRAEWEAIGVELGKAG
jgi:hypothetical protein